MSTVIISNVTGLYYHVRGESYARQVGDIVVNKVSSEISGSFYETRNNTLNARVDVNSDFTIMLNNSESTVTPDGNSIVLYDRTNTGVRIYASEGVLQIYYLPIDDQITPENTREGVVWKFDPQIYNGYEIKALYFARLIRRVNKTIADLLIWKNRRPEATMQMWSLCI